MADDDAAKTIGKAIANMNRWIRAIDARSKRKIRRSALHDVQQQILGELATCRFASPNGCSFRMLMSNVAIIASRESSDNMLQAWLESMSQFLEKQLQSRDPFSWRGTSKSKLYGLEIALPRKEWPYSFTDKKD